MSDLFENIQNLFTKKNKELSITDIYMTNRFLSMHPISFSQSFIINSKARYLPKEIIDYFFKITIPKMKVAPKIFYRKKKNIIDKKDIRNIKMISEIFHCSEQYSIQILGILKKQKIPLKNIFGEKGNKKIGR